MEDLAAADESFVAEPVLGWLGDPGLIGPPDAIAQEMGLGAEDLVEVDWDRKVALGRGKRGRSNGCGGRGKGGGGVGSAGSELEVGEKTVGPFAGGARAELGIGGGPEEKGKERRW